MAATLALALVVPEHPVVPFTFESLALVVDGDVKMMGKAANVKYVKELLA